MNEPRLPRLLDRQKWQQWAFVSESNVVYSREWVMARGGTKCIEATANATVILDRMVRRGRLEWYERMKR